MAKVLLTYDVKKTSDTVHSDLKKRLIDVYGYSSRVQSTTEKTAGKWYDLPNTCLVKESITLQQASTDFVKACLEVNAKWERFITVDYISSVFNNQ